MAERIFHFVFGLREQDQPLHPLHWLCLASCLAVNRPDAIHFHYRNEPHGPLWDAIRPALVLHRIEAATADHDRSRYRAHAEGRLIEGAGWHYAHEADFIRLDALLAHGGCYADMDTLFVRPYPDAWFGHDFAIGEEPSPHQPGSVMRPSLCNAVMFARPGSRFAGAWRQRMATVFDGTWNRHSCIEAAELWRAMPDALTVLPTDYFYRYASTRAGLAALLEQDDLDHPDLYSIHLWAHLWWDRARTDFSAVHAGQIDLDWLRREHNTLARLARPWLP